MAKIWSDFKIKKVKKGDKEYPKALLALKDPPRELYYRGELKSTIFKKSLAVVGTRKITTYGKASVASLIPSLVQGGVSIVSGFMYGVDTEAHLETVNCGGVTVAILGGGVNPFYPPENDKLYTKILQNRGVVLSEYKPEQKPQLWMFPQRNRLVAALATLGVLVIEAGESSGSLGTAELALSMNKKVYCVPGPINSTVSKGTNKLIKEGKAKLVQGIEDILVVKPVKKNTKLLNLDRTETQIVEALRNETLSVDEIAIATSIPVIAISSKISLLALKGVVLETQGKFCIKNQ